MEIKDFFTAIFHTSIDSALFNDKHRIGKSRTGRPIYGLQFGRGSFCISLIAGCHADEPTGPILLKKLVSYLAQLDENHALLQEFKWQIVPHANPDGEAVNQRWYSETDEVYELAKYLKFSQREKPGDDVEFGFPKDNISALRPENEAIYRFWQRLGKPFQVHTSLHGMAKAFGPWFLIEPAWRNQSEIIQKRCRELTEKLGYMLFDIDRKGEKGFFRLAPGFATRPDSEYMKAFFLAKNDQETAAQFHASSMESIRSLGGDCVTLVTEMPLFILPQKDFRTTWPHPELLYFSNLFNEWKKSLLSGLITESEINEKAKNLGIRSMPVKDQMRLQWELIDTGISAQLNFQNKAH